MYDVLKANKKLNEESHVAQSAVTTDRYLGRSQEEMNAVLAKLIEGSPSHNKQIVSSEKISNKPHVGLKAWGVVLPSWRREQNNE